MDEVCGPEVIQRSINASVRAQQLSLPHGLADFVPGDQEFGGSVGRGGWGHYSLSVSKMTASSPLGTK